MRSLREKVRYALLIDVGSGSIGFAIAASSQKEKRPNIIWEKREYLQVRNIESIEDSNKALISALTDMAMSVPGEGIKILREHTNFTKNSIAEVQVTVAAPWSYSVSRTITYEQEETFSVTNELIHDLAVAAGEEAMRNFKDKYAAVLHDVTETSRCVLDAYANGYRLPSVNKQQTNTLTLTHTTTLVYTALHKTLTELNEKLFSDVPLHVTSSMLGFYYATKQLKPYVYDVCLIDVTDEATEIGIVRNGSLTYCTHTAFGTLALAREVAQDAKTPLTEIVSRLGDILQEKANPSTATIIEEYKKKIVELFKETGDSLSIPRTIYLLADQNVVKALRVIIAEAGVHASKTNTTILSIEDLLPERKQSTRDFSIETAARFFHTTQNRQHFEYL